MGKILEPEGVIRFKSPFRKTSYVLTHERTDLLQRIPPHNYGGAGVHVEYLTRELSKLPDVDVDVRAFGEHEESDYP